MKQSKTAIKELAAAYAAVLKRAFIASMGFVVVLPAFAERVVVAENDLYPQSDGMVLNISDKMVSGADDDRPRSIIYVNPDFATGDKNVQLDVGAVSKFTNNLTDGGVFSVGVGTVLSIGTDSVFDSNTATVHGGAISNYGWLELEEDVSFVNNSAAQGGALYADKSTLTIVHDADFLNNTATYNGGAISAYGDDTAKLFISDSEFKLNHATGVKAENGEIVARTGIGGAIFNTMSHSGMPADKGVYVSDSEFVSNVAAVDGGAIYNAGRMNIDDGEFLYNNAERYGGAIFNGREMTINDTTFNKNHAYIGGGFMLGNNSDTVITNSTFRENTATFAGAGYTSVVNTNLHVDKTKFIKNSALSVGALGVFSSAELSNVIFSENSATDMTDDGAGALFLGAVSQTEIDKSEFIKNTSASVGGAIAMRAADVANNSAAKLDITNSMFYGNVSETMGGAIFSTFYNSATVVDSVAVSQTRFVGNRADLGGAIYNEGLPDKAGNLASMALRDVAFTGNNAKTAGGAIYNAAGATVNLLGVNTFSGNTRGTGGVGQPNPQVANDIHNLGVLNILSGETTFASGISGNGTLTVADGSIMNIGTAKIEQATLNINGVVSASIVDSRAYGRFFADNYNFGKKGTLKLNVGAVGTYNIFNRNAGDVKIDAGLTYTATLNPDGSVVIATKSVDDLAADTGLSTRAAGAVAGLANSHERSLSTLSLRVQNALDAGQIEYVEHQVGKLNPVEKPVAHSVATSNQNQVMNMLANRMAGLGAIGRNGGDVSAEYGFWAHGLINKSKYGAQFHGYTRGTAVGFDALINRAFTIGAGYGYASTDMHAHDRDTDIDSDTLFVYAQYKPKNGYINGAVSYTKSEYSEHMDVFNLKFQSKHDVKTYGAQAMAGYDFRVGLTPEIGARYMHMTQDGYNTGLADVHGADSDFLTGVAGMKYSFLIHNNGTTKWRPELRAAATYDVISDDTALTVTMPGAAPYIVDGDRLSRMGGEFGIGLTAQCPGLTLTVSYDLDLHDGYTSQTGMAKFKLMF